MSYIVPEPGSKSGRSLKQVWIIGAWDLDIVCFLLYDAWYLLNSRTPPQYDTLYISINVIIGQNTTKLSVLINFI